MQVTMVVVIDKFSKSAVKKERKEIQEKLIETETHGVAITFQLLHDPEPELLTSLPRGGPEAGGHRQARTGCREPFESNGFDRLLNGRGPLLSGRSYTPQRFFPSSIRLNASFLSFLNPEP
jgi:hypothetical protein